MSRLRLAALVIGLAAFLAGTGPVLAATSQILADQPMPSRALGRALPVTLYLPAAARTARDRLPIIILLHGVAGTGDDWVARGDIQATADRLIAEGRMPPAIIAMPSSGNSWYVNSEAIGGPGNYETAIGTELPLWLATHWNGREDRRGRTIAGYSIGGFGALHLAFQHPERWAAAGAMSGTFLTLAAAQGRIPRDNPRIFDGAFGRPFDQGRLLAASPVTLARALAGRPAPAIFLSCGREDFFHLTGEMTAMATQLRAEGVPVATVVTNGGHDWNTWHTSLPALLTFLGSHLTGTEGTLISAAAPRGGIAMIKPASTASIIP
jgi:S-formylglutathione hydrolase FrmB